MTPTPSNPVQVGWPAPPFTLHDTVSGQDLSLDQLKLTTATLIMFICNHCPYVRHVQAALVQLALDYRPHGVSCIAVSSNDAVSYPADGPEQMAQVARQAGYPFPYLYDETQSVARAYDAACTPDFYLFDGRLQLAYHGRLDASTPSNGKPNDGRDLRAALDAVCAGRPAPQPQHPSVGCSIKWVRHRAS